MRVLPYASACCASYRLSTHKYNERYQQLRYSTCSRTIATHIVNSRSRKPRKLAIANLSQKNDRGMMHSTTCKRLAQICLLDCCRCGAAQVSCNWKQLFIVCSCEHACTHIAGTVQMFFFEILLWLSKPSQPRPLFVHSSEVALYCYCRNTRLTRSDISDVRVCYTHRLEYDH